MVRRTNRVRFDPQDRHFAFCKGESRKIITRRPAKRLDVKPITTPDMR